MKKNQVIKAARARVGKLYIFGGNYRYNWYDPTVNAWRESTPRPYAAAQFARSQRLVDIARELGDLDPVQYDGGKWTDYL